MNDNRDLRSMAPSEGFKAPSETKPGSSGGEPSSLSELTNEQWAASISMNSYGLDRKITYEDLSHRRDDLLGAIEARLKKYLE